jgi:hypothetical protein
MYHKEGDFFYRSVGNHFLSGGMGNFSGTQNQHIRAAKLFLDAPFLAGKYFEMNTQGFCRLDVFPVEAIHAAY